MFQKIDNFLLELKIRLLFGKIVFLKLQSLIEYILIILIVTIYSFLIPMLVDLLQLLYLLPIYNFYDFYSTYHSLYTNTGIALIGLSALIFTLKTFKQQSLNEYMNSVFQKMFDTKLDTYIQYWYLCILTLFFLFVPNINIFRTELAYFIGLYYLSLSSILLIFGIELINISNKMNKNYIIKELEKRAIYLYDIGEKCDASFNNFVKKYNLKPLPNLFFIQKFNSTFVAYTQCINLLVKNSFNDPIIFSEAMSTLYLITKNRLDKRKNKFNDFDVPFLSEIIPTKTNDTFIENFLLEYLDDYAKLSLEQRNKDNLGTIERTYKLLLLAGKDNRYLNNNSLELTVTIIFTYYLKMLNYVVDFNNENMLFQTLEIFKDLFLNNRDYYVELVDKNYCDATYILSVKALEKNSFMNYRNIQGILTIGLSSVLFSNHEYREVYLDYIFKALKDNLKLLYQSKGKIVEYDGARIYLNYIFNSLEPMSVLNIYKIYYNSNISENGSFINEELLLNNDYSKLLDFVSDKGVILCLSTLYKSKCFVTCKTNILSIFEFLLQISAIIYSNTILEECKDSYIHLFRRTLESTINYINLFDSNASTNRYEINKFYIRIADRAKHYIIGNDVLKKSFFESYETALFNTYVVFDDEFKLEDFLEYLISIQKLHESEEDVNTIITAFLTKIKDNCTNICTFVEKYINLKHGNMNGLFSRDTDTRLRMENTALDVITSSLDFCNKKELIALYTLTSGNRPSSSLKKAELLSIIKDSLSS